MTTSVSIVLDQETAAKLHERAVMRGETIGRLILEAIVELDGHADPVAKEGITSHEAALSD